MDVCGHQLPHQRFSDVSRKLELQDRRFFRILQHSLQRILKRHVELAIGEEYTLLVHQSEIVKTGQQNRDKAAL